MKTIFIYHNPRCSKSREALALLLGHNLKPKIIEYLKTPLTTKDISNLLKMLALSPREIMRKNEPIYKELALDNPKMTNSELIKCMAENPILIERPIVVIDNKAVIARPAEKIMELM